MKEEMVNIYLYETSQKMISLIHKAGGVIREFWYVDHTQHAAWISVSRSHITKPDKSFLCPHYIDKDIHLLKMGAVEVKVSPKRDFFIQCYFWRMEQHKC